MTPPSTWAEVTRQEPCSACGRGDFCRSSSDGAFLCRRGPFDGATEKQDKNGVPFWVGFPNGVTPTAPTFEADTGPQPAPVDQLDRVYRELLSHLTLSPAHRQQLLARGFTGEEVDRLGFRSLDQAARQVAKRLADLFPFWQAVPGLYLKNNRPALGGWAGLLIPCRDLQGRVIALRIRADSPDAPRYTWLSSERHGGPGPGAPLSYWAGAAGAQADAVRATEGELKAALAALRTGIPTVAAPGVGLFGGNQVLDWLLELGAARVILSPDSDHRTNPNVHRAVCNAITRLGAVPYPIAVETWEPTAKGIDDALLAGLPIQSITTEEFHTMSKPDEPRPLSKAELTKHLTDKSKSNGPRILSKAEQATAATDEAAPPEDWGPPLPLTQTEATEPFPLEALGDGPFRKYVEDLAEYSQTAPEMGAFTCLTLAGAVTQKRVRVASGMGRDMPVNLQTMIIQASGEGKSTVLEAAGAPVNEVQRRIREQATNEKEARELRCEEIEDTLAGLAKDDPSRKTLKAELARLKATANPSPRLFTSDPSAEAMEPLLAANNGCLIMMNAEAREFLEGLAGSHRDGCSNLKPILCGFSGEDWQTDRITRDGANIRKPFVPMVLMSQPRTVERLMKDRDFSERGALARMLLAWPAEPKVIPKSPWERQGMPGSSVEYWSRLIHALANIPTHLEDHDGPVPNVIPMSPAAVNLAKEFHRWTHEVSRGEGVLASIPQTGKRLAEIAQRVAATLHLIDNILGPTAPWDTAITAETYSRAVRIVRWSIEAVLEVHFSALGARTVTPAHTKVWKVVADMLAAEQAGKLISVREVHKKIRSQAEFRSASVVRAALNTLEDMNYLRFVDMGEKKRGRPSEKFMLNPAFWSPTGFCVSSPPSKSTHKNTIIEKPHNQAAAIVPKHSHNNGFVQAQKPKTSTITPSPVISSPVLAHVAPSAVPIEQLFRQPGAAAEVARRVATEPTANQIHLADNEEAI